MTFGPSNRAYRLTVLIGLMVMGGVVFVAPVAQAHERTVSRMVDVGGRKLHIESAGEAQRRPGQPAVVLVAGLGNTLEAWRLVQPEVARLAHVVSYDRAGLGRSDPDTAARTHRHIAAELRSLLEKAGVRPPYVLVGHSLGAAYIRMFAAAYPNEVAGLVYVDPTDFTQSRDDQLAIWTGMGPGDDGLKAYRAAMREMFRKMPAAASAEGEMVLQVEEGGWDEYRALPALPDIPLVIVAATRFEPLPPGFGEGLDERSFADLRNRQRIEHYRQWAREVGDGTVVVTGRSGHFINLFEPELVAWAIRRALHPDPLGRLTRAAEEGGARGVIREYRTIKPWYPRVTLNEFLLNRVGYGLLRSGKVDDAIAVFRLNVEEHATAANAHDSLGEAYAARGDWTLAVRSYERSLQLDGRNRNAAQRLDRLRKCVGGAVGECPKAN